MNATVLRMLSTNSLTAFSAATTAAPAGKAGAIRLVREPLAAAAAQQKSVLPKDLPSIVPPRGSLLNLSV